MKTGTILLFVVLMNLSLHAQTKSETIDWLNSKLEWNRPVEYDNLLKVFEASSLKISSDGSFKVISTKYSSLIPETIKGTVESKGHFKDASLNDITIEKLNNGNYILVLKCSLSDDCFSQTNYDNKGNSEFFSKKYLVCIAEFCENEYDLALRCKKAVEQLIKLCGGKSEPY